MPALKVNNEIINTVHVLSNNGVSIKNICASVNLCEATVKRIKRAKNLDEYKNIIKYPKAIQRKQNTVVTNNNFNAVKVMLKTGIPRKDICSVLGLSNTTVRYIDNCNSLEEYRKYVCDCAKKSYYKGKQKKTTIVEGNRSASSYYNENRIYEALREQNELLKLISAKMVYIVEQLS